jgi:hypothetical protein
MKGQLKMNKKSRFLYFLFVTVCLLVVPAAKISAQGKVSDTGQLVLRFEAKYTGSIGWGDVYRCRVNEVCIGNLEDSVIVLFIVVNNYDNIFYTQDEKIDQSIPSKFLLKGSFKIIENDKSYLNGTNAFMDQKKQTWELISLEKTNNN